MNFNSITTSVSANQVTQVPSGPLTGANGAIASATSIASVPIQDAGGQVFSVKAGANPAAGDGTTDDRSAIQARINAAATAGGAVVLLPPGTYDVSADGGVGLTIPNNTSSLVIRGSGIGNSTIRWHGTPSLGGTLVSVNGTSITVAFEDLALQGPLAKFGSTSSPNCQGLVIESSSTVSGTVTLRRVQIAGFYQGIHVSPGSTSGNSNALEIYESDLQSFTPINSAQQGSGSVVISHTVIHGCGAAGSNLYHGMYIYPSNSLLVDACDFYDYCPTATGYAGQLYGPSDVGTPGPIVISNTTIDGSFNNGLLTNANGLTQIAGCTIAAKNAAIATQGQVAITNCRVGGTGRGLIDFGASTISVSDTWFQVSDTSKAMIALSISGTTIHGIKCRFPYHTSAQAATYGVGVSAKLDAPCFINSGTPGTSTNANLPGPSVLGAGAQWFDTTNSVALVSTGSAWQQAAPPANVPTTWTAPQTFAAGASFTASPTCPIVSPNLLTTAQADIEGTAASAWGGTPGTASVVTSPVWNGRQALAITSSSSADQVFAQQNPQYTAVTANSTYTFSGYVNSAATSRQVRPQISWYDASKAFITTVNGTTIGSTVGSWTQFSATAVAPSNAAFATVQFRILSTVNGEVHYLDGFSFNLGTSLAWQLPGTATLTLNGNGPVAGGQGGVTSMGVTSPNLLTPNQASIESDTTGLNAGTGTSIARVTTQALDGIASLSLTATSAGTISASTGNLSASSPANYFTNLGANAPGQNFTALASVKAATAGRTCNVQIKFWDVNGNSLGTTSSANFTDSTTAWVQGSVTAVAPANATQASVIIQVVGTSLSEVHYVDCLSISQGEYTRWFPPGTGNLNFDGQTLSISPTSGPGNVKVGHLLGSGSLPTIAAGSGAGIGTATLSAGSTDMRGVITVTPSGSPSSSTAVATVTFSAPYPQGSPMVVQIDEVNPAAIALSGQAAVGATSWSSTGFTISVGSTALAASTTYTWSYVVVG